MARFVAIFFNLAVIKLQVLIEKNMVARLGYWNFYAVRKKFLPKLFHHLSE